MKRAFRGFAVLLCLTAVLAAALYFFAPWKKFLETRLIAMIYARGFQNIAFNIDDVGLGEATLSNVILGKENPLILKSIALQYSPRELMSGKLRDIVLSDLTFEIRQGEDGWHFTGRDVLRAPDAAKEKLPVDLPALLGQLPFSSLTIENSRLIVAGDSVQGNVEFTATLTDRLLLTTKPTSMAAGGKEIAIGALELVAASEDATGTWNGAWKLETVNFGDSLSVPPLHGTGSVSLEKSVIALAGDFADDAKSYTGSFQASFDVADPAKNSAKLLKASMPFKQGRVTTKDVVLKAPMTVPISVQRVSVDDLFSSLTGGRVTATGTVSGNIPVIVRGDGTYALGRGSLKADSAGMIQMEASLIPSDQEQVALVRQILENLNYSVLSAEVISEKGGRMTVRLTLEGNNPKVYNGRAVKLNINLTGDILDFIQQNIMLFHNPEKLLETNTR